MSSGRWRWLVLAGAGLATVLVATRPAGPTAPANLDRWGVDELRIHRSAGGHLLDLRYRVVDAKRAESLLAEDREAYLVHGSSGRRLDVPSTPKAGRLRTTGTPEAGRSYFALFANPGRLVQPGERVTVVLGDLMTDLTVE